MASHNRDQVTRIDLNEIMRRTRDMVFVDARSATSLKRNPTQIPGAIHVPIKELDRAVEELPRNRELVTYCT